MKFTKSILIKNTILTGLALAFTGLTRVIYGIAVAKSFNADILGQMNLVISITMLLSLAISIITESSATKFLSEFPSDSDRKNTFALLLRWLLIGSLILIVATYSLQNYILQYTKIDNSVFIISLPLILLISAHHFYRGCFYGLNAIDKYLKLELVSTALFFLVLGAAIFIWGQNLLWPFLAYYLLFTLLGAASLKEYFRPSKKPFALSRYIGIYGIVATIGTLASTSKAYLANISIGIYLSPEQVGFYSAAISITTILMYAPTILGRVLLPTISSSYGAGDVHTIKKLLDITTVWLSIAVFFLGGILIILSKEILISLFTPAFSEAAFSLQTLILDLCLATMVLPAVSALVGTKYVRIPAFAAIFGTLVSIAVWPYLIPKFGIDGAAAGYIIGTIVYTIVPLFYAKKYFDMELGKLSYMILLSFFLFGFATAVGHYEKYSCWITAFIFAALFLITFRKDLSAIYYELRANL
jgi:O-antigen/teichoic acid export membrane protein